MSAFVQCKPETPTYPSTTNTVNPFCYVQVKTLNCVEFRFSRSMQAQCTKN